MQEGNSVVHHMPDQKTIDVKISNSWTSNDVNLSGMGEHEHHEHGVHKVDAVEAGGVKKRGQVGCGVFSNGEEARMSCH